MKTRKKLPDHRLPEEKVDLDKFRVRHGEPQVGDQPDEVTGRGKGGTAVGPRSPECLARAVKDPSTGKTRYFVRFVNEGQYAGRMMNPFDENYSTRGGDFSAAGLTGFRPVTKLAHDQYVRFLSSGNPAHLRQAEREANP